MPWAAALLVVLSAGPGGTQGNIDAGKTPAQIYSDTCANCHRRPQELRRPSSSFLRQHYTTGSEEAAAMASYLASIPADPRGSKDRAKTQQDRLKAQQERIKAQQERLKAQQERAKSQAKAPAQQVPAVKSRRATVEAMAPSGPPADTSAPEPAQRAEAPAVPKLEPFEE
jgi:hypothetical protein